MRLINSCNSLKLPTHVVINDGSGGPEPLPESRPEPILETEAHLGNANAPIYETNIRHITIARWHALSKWHYR